MSANVEGRGLIHQGDKTTTGGIVTQGVGNVMLCGSGVTQTGMEATCPSCKKGKGNIIPLTKIDVIVDGIQAALHGDVVACGCPYGDNTVIASAGAMNFKVENGLVMGFKPFDSKEGMDSAYQTMADSIGGQYNPNASSSVAGQQAYDFIEKEWNAELSKTAKEYQWDMSEQCNLSIAMCTVQEANEYLELLKKDTHGQLSTGKDYVGVATGLRGAYEVVKELGGWGVVSKAVNINGVMNIVIENYKPRYLDLGIRWQEATPQMLKIGHALNTVKGNVNFLTANVFVEIVFSGAVNSIDYALHNEKELGEVVGQFSTDVIKGVVAGVIAQGITVLGVGILSSVFIVPTALTLGVFAVTTFLVGNEISQLDEQYKFTKPIKERIESAINDLE